MAPYGGFMKHRNRSTLFRALAITSAATLTMAGSAWADDESSKPTAGSAAATQTASSVDKKAARFLTEAAQDNQLEIAMGELGVARAQNAELKSFAQRLQQDEAQSKLKLTALAQKHGVKMDPQVKVDPQEMPDKHLERLHKLSGAEFDREFMMTALKQHQKNISRHEKAIEKVEAADVKEYAQETLPKLRQRLSQAGQVAQAVGIDSATIAAYTRPGADAVGGSTSTGEGTDEPVQGSREFSPLRP